MLKKSAKKNTFSGPEPYSHPLYRAELSNGDEDIKMDQAEGKGGGQIKKKNDGYVTFKHGDDHLQQDKDFSVDFDKTSGIDADKPGLNQVKPNEENINGTDLEMENISKKGVASPITEQN